MFDGSKLPISRVDRLDNELDGIQTLIDLLLEPGDICYSIRTSKNGWLLCDGQSYSIDDYPRLFDVIGYTFGGEKDYFNVPNYSGKFLQMDSTKTIGTNVEAGLPNLTGQVTSEYNIVMANNSQSNGVFRVYGTSPGLYGGSRASSEWGYGWTFDASRCSTIYGNSETVQPESSIVNYFIKY